MGLYVLTVTLNPAIDKTVSVPGFQAGKDFREEALSVSAGGKGINVSRSLNSLGVKNIATGFAGGYCGSYILDELKKEGIKSNFLKVKENTRTSLTVIDTRRDILTRVLERGPHITKEDAEKFKLLFIKLLKKSSFVALSGRNVPGAGNSFYAELIDMANQYGIPSVLDTSGRPYPLGIEQKPFMIKPNLKEAEFITGRPLNSLQDVKKAAILFHKKGVKITAISMGSKGALVFDGKDMFLGLPPKVKRKNPVGCGDSFIAGFIYSCLKKQDILQCTRMAVASGTTNVLGITPGFINPDTVNKILKQTRVKKIKF